MMASSTHPEHSSSCTSADVEQPSIDQAAAITHRFRQLKVHIDMNTASPSSSSATIHQDESLAEERLIERLEEVINEFMTRPNRHYSYNTTLHWTVDHGHEINYSAVILIHPPSD